MNGARELFLLTTRLTRNTFRTVLFACADKPPDPLRKLEYSSSIPPLNRTILDSIFTIIFLLEDLPTRCEWYYKAGWREAKLELTRFEREYGHLKEWESWLKDYSAWVDGGMSEFGITESEASGPGSIEAWPTPGRMPRYRIKKSEPLPASRKYLSFLNDWFYRDLSQQSHLSSHGLMKRGGFLLAPDSNRERMKERLGKFKSDQTFTAVILMLALLSEIESHFKFGFSGRAKYIWVILSSYSEVARELYDSRYSSLLEGEAETSMR